MSFESLKKCPVTVKDVPNACVIYDQKFPGLAGRLTRQKPKRVDSEYTGTPPRLYERHKYFILAGHVMFMNRIAFLVTLFRGIIFYTCEYVPNQKVKQKSRSLRKIVNMYIRGGFNVRTIIMDMELEKVK